MSKIFSEEEKSQLRSMIQSPVFVRAMQEALGTIWRAQSAAEGQEACALAFAYYKGSCEVLSAIHMIAEKPIMVTPKPSRLNHRA
jgi:hypothetical protein